MQLYLTSFYTSCMIVKPWHLIDKRKTLEENFSRNHASSSSRGESAPEICVLPVVAIIQLAIEPSPFIQFLCSTASLWTRSVSENNAPANTSRRMHAVQSNDTITRVHCVTQVDNISACLKLLGALGIPLEGVNAPDIHQGNLKSILVIFFALSRHKQQQKLVMQQRDHAVR